MWCIYDMILNKFYIVQGVSLNWSYPKNHKNGKKFKYQNWSSPKIHKYQNWYPPQICNYGAALKVIDFQVIIIGICNLLKHRNKDSCVSLKGKPRTTVDPVPDHVENRLPAQLSSLKPNMVVTS